MELGLAYTTWGTCIACVVAEREWEAVVLDSRGFSGDPLLGFWIRGFWGQSEPTLCSTVWILCESTTYLPVCNMKFITWNVDVGQRKRTTIAISNHISGKTNASAHSLKSKQPRVATSFWASHMGYLFQSPPLNFYNVCFYYPVRNAPYFSNIMEVYFSSPTCLKLINQCSP